jgi:hypothetical protein
LFGEQEVQFKNPNHYEQHYLPHFTRLGYSAAMKSRTRDKEDGCAIFFKEIFTRESCRAFSVCEYFYQGCGFGLIQSGSGSRNLAQSGSVYGSTMSLNPDPQ